MSRLSRRSLLGVGALAGVGTVVGSTPAVASAATPTALPSSLVLHGHAMRRLTGAGRAAVGDTHSVRGELTGTAASSRGEVFHTGHVVARAGTGHPDDVATVEQHLFVMPEGTLAGAGTVTHAGRGTFVVVGGTGRFAGARGSYTTTQTADVTGGGEARYDLTLTTDL